MKLNQLLIKSGFRHWLHHPWQFFLAVGGIAMGVAMVVAIELASQSARAAYLWSTESLSGTATHQIQGVEGFLPESIFVKLNILGIHDGNGLPITMVPVIETRMGFSISTEMNSKTTSRISMRLIGVDPFSAMEMAAFGIGKSESNQSYLGKNDSVTKNLSQLMVSLGSVLISKSLQAKHNLKINDFIYPSGIAIDSHSFVLKVIGILDPKNKIAETSMQDLIFCDISTAQNILNFSGKLTRIDLDLSRLKQGQDSLIIKKISSYLNPGLHLVPTENRTHVLDNLTRAFRINLTALSLLALLVGAFLIYNTMTFSVAQRWRWLGTLRGLGVTSYELGQLVGMESLILGLVGTLVGIPLGILLGQGLVVLVSQTINDLYFSTQVTGLTLEVEVLFKGLLLGIGVTLLAGILPAYQASKINPRNLWTRSSQETRLLSFMPKLWLLGLALIVLSLALCIWPNGGIILGFGSLIAVTLAFTCWTPGLLLNLMRGLGWLFNRIEGVFSISFMLPRMAIRGVGASLSRTGIAAAALMAALSVTIAMGVLVDSFRMTVNNWLAGVLVADIYVSPPIQDKGKLDFGLDSTVIKKILATPGILGGTSYMTTVLREPQGQVQILAMDMHPLSYKAFHFLKGNQNSVWNQFHRNPNCGVLISEPFSYKRKLKPGMDLSLATRTGKYSFPVLAIFPDYGSEQGTVIIDRACYDNHWESQKTSSIALFILSNHNLDSLMTQIKNLPESQFLEINSNRGLRKLSLEIFDRTFSITLVLRWIAVFVSVVGLIGALAALEMERSQETSLLRAMGLSTKQVWLLTTAQSMLLGLATACIAIPLGLIQSGLLIEVINRRSFGWSMNIHYNFQIILETILMGVSAGFLAGALSAWRKLSKGNEPPLGKE